MSYAMTDVLVRDHMRDVRDQVARCRGRSPRPGQVHGATPRPDPRRSSARLSRSLRLRSRVVEAGLHLLADSPQPRGRGLFAGMSRRSRRLRLFGRSFLTTATEESRCPVPPPEIEGDVLRWTADRTRCTVTMTGGGMTQVARHESSADGVNWTASMDVTLRKVA